MLITSDNASIELLKFREKHGITQDQLSERSGVSKPTIIDIEKGRKKPRATTVFKLNRITSLYS